jgi:hypothetical protein
MKLALFTLLAAAAFTLSLPTAAHYYGTHSTPFIRFSIANLAGTAVGLLVSSWIEGSGKNDFGFWVRFCFLCALVNWAFYFYLIKGAVFLKRRLLN